MINIVCFTFFASNCARFQIQIRRIRLKYRSILIDDIEHANTFLIIWIKCENVKALSIQHCHKKSNFNISMRKYRTISLITTKNRFLIVNRNKIFIVVVSNCNTISDISFALFDCVISTIEKIVNAIDAFWIVDW